MKLLSVAIPCYNSEGYMENCIQSLLVGGDEVEIIIVNDGSKDATAEIADRWAAAHPDIIKAVHQENAGHGGAVNAGLEAATGRYFKVVDSDDWVDAEAYSQILTTIQAFGDQGPDMLISNYVYEKQGRKNRKVVHYQNALPTDKLFTWDEVHHLRKGQYILMHSVIYRTQLLRESSMKLPEHTFYVDNLFVFQPLPFVKSLYYMDVDFYRYFIGREDQSVNETVMIRRVDQQIRVTKLMIDSFVTASVDNERLWQYMRSYLDINMTIASIMLLLSGTQENLEKKRELWQYLRLKNSELYRQLRVGLLGSAVNLPGKGGRRISIYAYKVVQRHFGFN